MRQPHHLLHPALSLFECLLLDSVVKLNVRQGDSGSDVDSPMITGDADRAAGPRAAAVGSISVWPWQSPFPQGHPTVQGPWWTPGIPHPEVTLFSRVWGLYQIPKRVCDPFDQQYRKQSMLRLKWAWRASSPSNRWGNWGLGSDRVEVTFRWDWRARRPSEHRDSPLMPQQCWKFGAARSPVPTWTARVLWARGDAALLPWLHALGNIPS